MKTLLKLTLATLSLLSSSFLNAAQNLSRPKTDSASCLEISGKIEHFGNMDEIPCRIDLLCAGRIEDSLVLKPWKKKFRLVLKKNCYYTLRISKKGYADKLICINTAIPASPDGIYRFEFNTEMIPMEEASYLDRDAIDFPVALIFFDAGHECFDYNKKYTDNIRRQLLSSVATAK